METSVIDVQPVYGGEFAFSSVRVSTDDGMDWKCAEVFDASRVVHQDDGGEVVGYIGKGLLGVEITDP